MRVITRAMCWLAFGLSTTCGELRAFPAESPSLSRADLESLALQHHPAIAEAQAKLQSLHGKWQQMGLPPNAVIGYLGQQLWSGGAAEQQGLYVAQKFVRGGKLALNREVVCREMERANREWAIQHQKVITDVGLAHNDAWFAEQRVQLAGQLRKIAQDAQQSAKRLYQAQEVSQLDVLRARGELELAEIAERSAQESQRAAWGRLTAVVGLPELAMQPLTDSQLADETPFDPEATFARLLDSSPELAAARADVDRAGWAWRRATVESVADVDVQSVVQHDNATNGANAIVQVTLPLALWNRNQGGIRQARSELAAAEQATRRVELGLRQRWAAVYQAYATAHHRVEEYQAPDGVLATAQQALDLVTRGYKAGELDYLNLLSAQQMYSQAKLAYLEAQRDERAAEIELRGWLLKESLSPAATG